MKKSGTPGLISLALIASIIFTPVINAQTAKDYGNKIEHFAVRQI